MIGETRLRDERVGDGPAVTESFTDREGAFDKRASRAKIRLVGEESGEGRDVRGVHERAAQLDALREPIEHAHRLACASRAVDAAHDPARAAQQPQHPRGAEPIVPLAKECERLLRRLDRLQDVEPVIRLREQLEDLGKLCLRDTDLDRALKVAGRLARRLRARISRSSYTTSRVSACRKEYVSPVSSASSTS